MKKKMPAKKVCDTKRDKYYTFIHLLVSNSYLFFWGNCWRLQMLLCKITAHRKHAIRFRCLARGHNTYPYSLFIYQLYIHCKDYAMHVCWDCVTNGDWNDLNIWLPNLLYVFDIMVVDIGFQYKQRVFVCLYCSM